MHILFHNKIITYFLFASRNDFYTINRHSNSYFLFFNWFCFKFILKYKEKKIITAFICYYIEVENKIMETLLILEVLLNISTIITWIIFGLQRNEKHNFFLIFHWKFSQEERSNKLNKKKKKKIVHPLLCITLNHLKIYHTFTNFICYNCVEFHKNTWIFTE